MSKSQAERTLRRSNFRLYDVVNSDQVRVDASAPYINEIYLRIFLKYKLFSTDVMRELHERQTRDGTLTQLQFREIVDKTHERVFQVDRQVDKVLRLFEDVVAQLFIVKFSVMFNYFFRLYAFDRSQRQADDEAAVSFLLFLEAVFVRPVDDCLAPASNVDDFFDSLENDFERLYQFELAHNSLWEAAEPGSTGSSAPEDHNVLQFFDRTHSYQRTLVAHLERLAEQDSSRYFDDKELPETVSQLMNMMNYQMHMAISSPVINGASESHYGRWPSTWTFLTLAGWLLGHPTDFSVTFSESCHNNYGMFVRRLEKIRTNDASERAAAKMLDAFATSGRGLRRQELLAEELTTAVFQKLLAWLVWQTAGKLQAVLAEHGSKIQWAVYRYAFMHLNGMDTSTGVDLFLNKRLLKSSAFVECGFDGAKNLTKERACTFWTPRHVLWGVLSDNSDDVESVFKLLEDVEQMNEKLREQDERQRAWLDAVQQKRSPSSLQRDMPYHFVFDDQDGSHVDDDMSLLCDFFEMHVDIVLSCWFLLLLHLQRVTSSPVSVDDAATCALLASTVQTGNFGVEGTSDCLEFLVTAIHPRDNNDYNDK